MGVNVILQEKKKSRWTLDTSAQLGMHKFLLLQLSRYRGRNPFSRYFHDPVVAEVVVCSFYFVTVRGENVLILFEAHRHPDQYFFDECTTTSTDH